MDDANLIKNVRAYPVLYDPFHRNHTDYNLKEDIWNKISKNMKVDKESCKSRWMIMRECYKRFLKHCMSRNKSKRKYIMYNNYYKDLGFLSRSFKKKSIEDDEDIIGKLSKSYQKDVETFLKMMNPDNMDTEILEIIPTSQQPNSSELDNTDSETDDCEKTKHKEEDVGYVNILEHSYSEIAQPTNSLLAHENCENPLPAATSVFKHPISEKESRIVYVAPKQPNIKKELRSVLKQQYSKKKLPAVPKQRNNKNQPSKVHYVFQHPINFQPSSSGLGHANNTDQPKKVHFMLQNPITISQPSSTVLTNSITPTAGSETESANNEKPSPSLLPKHPIDIFLFGLSPILKTFSPYNLHLAKCEIFNIVQKYELQTIMAEQPSMLDLNNLL